ncbi:putative cytochrome b5 [Clavispora lusitaniae]|uniref:Cytochrome b5 heme-binding domain-containing protein n=3 Tax=Clavispora lusitaniae TaxID=36911 RepID=C4Y3Z3_CLAL4|nr:uncharacterized protein CLUG_02365 [Clavispora lusitaniae ATCC 42720]KAF5211501.1 hypothetical protein E0198_002815 [Clavispora lusitaniae]EEQ38239.1 hypothetical protein CLUG_02365 [Clavispora lusitaniae ATCC 42720]KAF7580358.1 Cytochrome b5-like Heme/Steroid binding domain family protein [Clavispora lusitaniae]OVF05489.1 putative cytochrome b5 [Clavispora lusitaniae]QFZ27925.1 putative cytochrome b5 [Clavispora lusitaniae]
MASTSKSPSIYSLSQVSKHATPTDLWVIIYNNVYDISDFVKDHPGGAEVLFDCGGVDATEAFEDVGHSQDAVDMLVPYYVGKLAPNECKVYRQQEEKIATTKIKAAPRSRKKPDPAGYRALAVVWMTLISMTVLVVLGLQKMHWINITSK